MENKIIEPKHFSAGFIDVVRTIRDTRIKKSKSIQIMENKSLSARIKRRNAQGFYGVGTGHMVGSDGYVQSYTTIKAESGGMGDYTDVKQNHKERDYKDAAARKSRLGFNKYTKNRQLCKKYADKHQRLR